MFFLEIPILEKTDLGESLLSYFQKNKIPIDKNELMSLVRTHSVYFQNKPVGFLPFKVFKKGKAQVYLKQEGWSPEVIYEDKWLIVVNKPSGLPSQSSLKPLQDHAYSSVMCMLREKKPFTSPQLFLMHRLDTDTSGVLLMTKKSSAN
jgi:23S rRNA pseudouridine1911/1915/1917 synthase